MQSQLLLLPPCVKKPEGVMRPSFQQSTLQPTTAAAQHFASVLLPHNTHTLARHHQLPWLSLCGPVNTLLSPCCPVNTLLSLCDPVNTPRALTPVIAIGCVTPPPPAAAAAAAAAGTDPSSIALVLLLPLLPIAVCACSVASLLFVGCTMS
jgi:hypothetical protein